MKQIPQEIKGRDFHIILLKHIHGAQPRYNAIYGLALYLNKSDGYLAGCEVHILRRRQRKHHVIKDKDGRESRFTSPHQEFIARSQEFGRYAWSFPDLEIMYQSFPVFKEFNDEIIEKIQGVKECLKK